MKNRLKLSLEVGDIPPVVKADERKLKQILYNLLSNAAKFTLEGGTISLGAMYGSSGNGHETVATAKKIGLSGKNGDKEANNDTQFVEIYVKDSGTGLSADDLERIFDPFEQADNSTSRKYHGTGLGLSLTRQFVELQGGKIWAESEGIGKGTTFRFVIPTQNSNSSSGMNS